MRLYYVCILDIVINRQKQPSKAIVSILGIKLFFSVCSKNHLSFQIKCISKTKLYLFCVRNISCIVTAELLAGFVNLVCRGLARGIFGQTYSRYFQWFVVCSQSLAKKTKENVHQVKFLGFLAPTRAQGMQMFVCLSDEKCSRAHNLHLLGSD